ncbi:Tetratricopeptide-like helical domain [Cinara cedri]|uniref:Tetratricopeptide-like helical domain n=1 Tax=Cinara cedri TaxID=506608 RepID=A0A5E4MXA5_9HEMI|nr:Tetratricopeptide-like helical domain [Cinara cedri]
MATTKYRCLLFSLLKLLFVNCYPNNPPGSSQLIEQNGVTNTAWGQQPPVQGARENYIPNYNGYNYNTQTAPPMNNNMFSGNYPPNQQPMMYYSQPYMQPPNPPPPYSPPGQPLYQPMTNQYQPPTYPMQTPQATQPNLIQTQATQTNLVQTPQVAQSSNELQTTQAEQFDQMQTSQSTQTNQRLENQPNASQLKLDQFNSNNGQSLQYQSLATPSSNINQNPNTNYDQNTNYMDQQGLTIQNQESQANTVSQNLPQPPISASSFSPQSPNSLDSLNTNLSPTNLNQLQQPQPAQLSSLSAPSNPSPLQPQSASQLSSLPTPSNPSPLQPQPAPQLSSLPTPSNPSPLQPQPAPQLSSLPTPSNPSPLQPQSASQLSSLPTPSNISPLQPQPAPQLSSLPTPSNPSPLQPLSIHRNSCTAVIFITKPSNPSSLQPQPAPQLSSLPTPSNPSPLQPQPAPQLSSLPTPSNPSPLQPQHSSQLSSLPTPSNPSSLQPQPAPQLSSFPTPSNPSPLQPQPAPQLSSLPTPSNPSPLQPQPAPQLSSLPTPSNPSPLQPQPAPQLSSLPTPSNPSPLQPQSASQLSSLPTSSNPSPLQPQPAPQLSSLPTPSNPSPLQPQHSSQLSSLPTPSNPSSLQPQPAPQLSSLPTPSNPSPLQPQHSSPSAPLPPEEPQQQLILDHPDFIPDTDKDQTNKPLQTSQEQKKPVIIQTDSNLSSKDQSQNTLLQTSDTKIPLSSKGSQNQLFTNRQNFGPPKPMQVPDNLSSIDPSQKPLQQKPLSETAPVTGSNPDPTQLQPPENTPEPSSSWWDTYTNNIHKEDIQIQPDLNKVLSSFPTSPKPSSDTSSDTITVISNPQSSYSFDLHSPKSLLEQDIQVDNAFKKMPNSFFNFENLPADTSILNNNSPPKPNDNIGANHYINNADFIIRPFGLSSYDKVYNVDFEDKKAGQDNAKLRVYAHPDDIHVLKQPVLNSPSTADKNNPNNYHDLLNYKPPKYTQYPYNTADTVGVQRPYLYSSPSNMALDRSINRNQLLANSVLYNNNQQQQLNNKPNVDLTHPPSFSTSWSLPNYDYVQKQQQDQQNALSSSYSGSSSMFGIPLTGLSIHNIMTDIANTVQIPIDGAKTLFDTALTGFPNAQAMQQVSLTYAVIMAIINGIRKIVESTFNGFGSQRVKREFNMFSPGNMFTNPMQTLQNNLLPYINRAENDYQTIVSGFTGNPSPYNSQPASILNYQTATVPSANPYNNYNYNNKNNLQAVANFDQSLNTANDNMQQQQQQMQQQQQQQQMQQQQQQQQQQMQYYYNTNNVNTNVNRQLQNNNNGDDSPQMVNTPQTYVPDVLKNEIKAAVYANIPAPYTNTSPEVMHYYNQVISVVSTYFENQINSALQGIQPKMNTN